MGVYVGAGPKERCLQRIVCCVYVRVCVRACVEGALCSPEQGDRVRISLGGNQHLVERTTTHQRQYTVRIGDSVAEQ
jgi:hypothetical protein